MAAVTQIVPVGPEPTRMICPHCHSEIASRIQKENSTKAYIAGGLLALFGCVLGCCLIPCCMDSCKDVQHYCPKCNAYLGKFQR